MWYSFTMQLGEYNIPTLKKRSNKNTSPQHDGPVELFPSSGESDEEVGLALRWEYLCALSFFLSVFSFFPSSCSFLYMLNFLYIF